MQCKNAPRELLNYCRGVFFGLKLQKFVVYVWLRPKKELQGRTQQSYGVVYRLCDIAINSQEMEPQQVLYAEDKGDGEAAMVKWQEKERQLCEEEGDREADITKSSLIERQI